jgi:lysophospholipase L1-like esterase
VRRLGITVTAWVLAATIVGVPQVAMAEPTPTVTNNDSGAPAFEPMRVMPLGDSITRGAGSPSYNSYRMALAHRLLLGGIQINYVGSQENGTGTDIQHEGHGALDIDELSAQLDDSLAQERPDVVLLHAGTNNITQGDSGATTVCKLSGLIDQIRTARPDAYILVAQIISSRVPAELAQDRAYNRLIPLMVEAKNDPLITVVDQSSVGGIDLHDLHHPNDFGYSKMAYNWYTAMAKIFGASGDTGPNPYQATSAKLCLAVKVVVNGQPRHRTECRTWKLRTITITTDGVCRQVRTWQTLRTVKQTYRLWIHGTTQTRTYPVRTWTGPGNLLDI